MKSPAVLTVAVILCISAGMAQQSREKEAYDVDEAYSVYSVLLRQEEPLTIPLVIQQDTVQKPDAPACLTEEAAKKFGGAEADFWRVNRRRWILLRRFDINKRYNLVGEHTIRAGLKNGDDWEYYVFSAVGFNPDKTRAVVYMGIHCGSLCGHWSFHLLEKADKTWKQVSGVSCFAIS
jgi:hypothetical protein